ncbi:hypothetical protein PENANT_c064G04783 [Penicillium antarcticum]|uniref:Uncharacterized protein n=1 Tax=Penicillium antarcticum TaxID=416450 RepID=A0A1V6PLU9_9EURO|nr:hypothetical protein PENANT_c101G05811 [Penicillium antarcticum]OQD79059.1 hypothetical protein PENANT_c064G04783 [Penicillium antarcticum]
MDVDRLNELETIDPRPLPPWRKDAFTEIKLEPDREIARERAASAKDTSDIIVYSDASGRSASNGCQDIVKSQGTTLRTDWPKKLRSRGREWKSSTKGAHLRKIDGTLPARYTRKLYGNLPRNRAYLLTQLRTGHNWLSNYRKEIGYSEHDRVSSLLGGSNEGDKGKPDTVSRAKTVQAVLDFAEASQRFRSRAL